MSSIFLSHTSIDKPFVEKLAKDLKRLGINVWFDKWEITVGESITWKIDDGIRENEFLGIVLSPEALISEWVKSEISSGWVKQMQSRKVIILPILYRTCQIPLFLQDRKYANFTISYESGLDELAEVFGIKNTEVIAIENWRKFIGINPLWKKYRDQEFSELITRLVDKAIEYNWSSWIGGSKVPFSISLYVFITQEKHEEISIRLDGKTNGYFFSSKSTYNPNHLQAVDFDIYIGNSIDQVEEFCWRKMEDFRTMFGDPPYKGNQNIDKHLTLKEKNELAKDFVRNMLWYKGSKLL
jgi:hypothetical protein